MQLLRLLALSAVFILTTLCSTLWAYASERVVIIGHPNTPKLDILTLQRIYTGKVVEIDGNPIIPFNLPASLGLRQRFFSEYLHQDEEKFIAYWTVRRYVGKGTPPREVKDSNSMIDIIYRTPGAIGYIDEADLTPAMNVLLRK